MPLGIVKSPRPAQGRSLLIIKSVNRYGHEILVQAESPAGLYGGAKGCAKMV
jgi:hypothetical protein